MVWFERFVGGADGKYGAPLIASVLGDLISTRLITYWHRPLMTYKLSSTDFLRYWTCSIVLGAEQTRHWSTSASDMRETKPGTTPKRWLTCLVKTEGCSSNDLTDESVSSVDSSQIPDYRWDQRLV